MMFRHGNEISADYRNPDVSDTHPAAPPEKEIIFFSVFVPVGVQLFARGKPGIVYGCYIAFLFVVGPDQPFSACGIIMSRLFAEATQLFFVGNHKQSISDGIDGELFSLLR